MGERLTEVERVWLGAERPPASSAAQWIVRVAGASTAKAPDAPYAPDAIDLSKWLVIVPGARAGRLLLKALLQEAAGVSRPVDPPHIATPGALIERLFVAGQPSAVASPLERRLAWTRTLADAPRSIVSPLLPRAIEPSEQDWMRLGHVAARLEDALAAGGKDFSAAADEAEKLDGQRARFDALAQIAPRVRALLAEVGLVAADELRRTLLATGTIAMERVVVVATLDLGAPQRAALDSAANELPPGCVTALLAADESSMSRFDDFGCATEAWIQADLPIPNETIRIADLPRDQAELVVRAIADLAAAPNGLACDEVSIALADTSLSAALRSAGSDAGIRFHDAVGEPLLASRPARLLRAAAPWLRDRRPSDFAALIRLPIVDDAIRRSVDGGDPVAALDALRAAAVPATLDERCGAADDSDVVAATVGAIDALFAPFLADHSSPAAIIEVLRDERLRWSESDAAALRRIAVLAESVQALPAAIAAPDATTALELVLELAETESLPDAPRDDAVEAIGWLELLFEPAPHLVAMGMNADAIPSGTRHDPFLPDSLRAHLGLATRRSRLARDAALLDSVARRAASLTLIAGRTDDSRNPIAPSPLLLRCRGAELAARVHVLADPKQALARDRRWRRACASESRFVVPPVPESARHVKRVSVTSLRRYLECPFRFWLETIERIEAVDDDARELDQLGVGSLVHAALDRFAKDRDARDAVSARAIESLVVDAFDGSVRDAHGSHLLPAVRFQVMTLRERLRRFATWQAEHRAAGWRIVASELNLPDGASLDPPDVVPLGVSGRIDRIDVHEKTGRYRIIDYKTGEAGRSPRQEHRAGTKGDGEFTGLQLPLYRRFMAPALKIAPTEIEVGYVRLPLDPALQGWIGLDFAESEFDEAWTVALSVATRIRSGEFPILGAARDDDPFQYLLQTPVFGARVPDAEDAS